MKSPTPNYSKKNRTLEATVTIMMTQKLSVNTCYLRINRCRKKYMSFSSGQTKQSAISGCPILYPVVSLQSRFGTQSIRNTVKYENVIIYRS